MNALPGCQPSRSSTHSPSRHDNDVKPSTNAKTAIAMAMGTRSATNGIPMMVMAKAIDAATRNGTKKISAARPMSPARTGSATAARPLRATAGRAMTRIIAISMASSDTRAKVPARLSHRPKGPKWKVGNQPNVRRDQSPNEM